VNVVSTTRLRVRLAATVFTPQKTTVVGGQPATFGPAAAFDRAKLDKCVHDMFKVDEGSSDFEGSRSGGDFTGTRKGNAFEVNFDATSKNRKAVKAIGQRGRTEPISAVGVAPRGGWTVYVASDFASDPNTPDVSVTAV
jgi:hypothetical protein